MSQETRNNRGMRSLLLFISLLLTNFAEAHTLQTIKGEKALLILDGGPVQVGDQFQVTDLTGTEKAQIEIRQIKDQRAIAYIIKGELTQPPDTYVLNPQAPTKTTMETPPPATAQPLTPIPQTKGYYGGLSYNQMNVSLTSATTLKLTGTSFNLGAFYERAMNRQVQVLARAGYEGLKASGSLNSTACEGSNNCEVDIGYLNADAIVKYTWNRGSKDFWAGGGLGFLLPLLKKSNVIDTSKMTISEKLIIAGGMTWPLDAKTFVPIQLEYSIQPSNNVVSAQQLILRAGYGTRF